MSNLTSVIKSIQDIMRQDIGVDGDAQRISQLTWLLFLKVFDALEEELELTRDHYQSPIPEAMRWRNWAADPEGMTGDALLDFVDNQPFPPCKSLSADPARNPRGYVVRGVFEDAYNYMKAATCCARWSTRPNGIDFNRQAERHQFNDLYEKMLKDLQAPATRASSTPRAPSPSSWCDMVNPQAGRGGAGPGQRHRRLPRLRHRAHAQHRCKPPSRSRACRPASRGVEKKPLPHLLGVTNLMLHGIEVPSQIRHDNTLARPLRDYGQADRVDCIAHQPALWRRGRARHRSQATPPTCAPRKRPTCSWCSSCTCSRTGGRAAVVLPDGSLFGEGMQKPHQGKAAHRVQPAHHRAPAQRRVQPLHRHQDQPAVLHQGPADAARLVLRAPATRRA